MAFATKKIQLKSNYIFTRFGHDHFFGVIRCLLNWNNTSSVCPLCRENLYDEIISNNINLMIMQFKMIQCSMKDI